jgi:hypothetical protein
MLVDGFLALRRAAILRRKVAADQTGRENRAVLHAGFFVGRQQFYRELRQMPRVELEEIVMTAISFTTRSAAMRRARLRSGAMHASSTPR